MKKRVYIQLNLFVHMIALFFLLCSIVCLYAMAVLMMNKRYILFFVFFGIFIFTLFEFVRFEHNRIELRKDIIFVPNDWMNKKERIQYEIKIDYASIIDLKIIRSTKNSNNKPIPSSMLSSKYLKPYLEIICIDGKTYRIFIMYYTKKQIINLIEDIKKRTSKYYPNIQKVDAIELLKDISKGGFSI